ILCGKTDLKPAVPHFTTVNAQRCKARSPGEGCAHKHLGGKLIIEIDRTAYPVIEKGEIDTHIKRSHCFPLKVGIGRLNGRDALLSGVVEARPVKRQRLKVADTALPTLCTVACTQFEIVHKLELLNEFFSHKVP